MNITKESVFKIASMSKDRLSTREVREKLGKGSLSTISKYLREYYSNEVGSYSYARKKLEENGQIDFLKQPGISDEMLDKLVDRIIPRMIERGLVLKP